MAVAVQVAGLATIKIAAAVGSPLYTLGYTQNGAFITTEGYTVNVPGDENGGDDGPPIEIQSLGETARVRLEFTKGGKLLIGSQDPEALARALTSRAPQLRDGGR